MCCRRFWKSVAPFSLTFALSVFAANVLLKNNCQIESKPTVIFSEQEKSSMNGADYGTGDGSGGKIESGGGKIKILSKARADYTEAARQNQTIGVVRLRVTFLANGEIGKVEPVSVLPYGLTEQAIAAAKQIKFEPAVRDGQPITTTKIVEYSFSIY